MLSLHIITFPQELLGQILVKQNTRYWLNTSLFNFDAHKGLTGLVAYATRFLAVRLKSHVRSHHRALKAKVKCDFPSGYSPDHTNDSDW